MPDSKMKKPFFYQSPKNLPCCNNYGKYGPIFLFFLLFQTQAAIVDTAIIGDGGPGPYYLGSSFIDTSSISITLPDSELIPQWTFISDHNALLFSEPIDSGAAIRVSFSTTFYGVPKIFSLYPRTWLALDDTAGTLDTAAGRTGIRTQDENISVSGYKSFGLSLGSLGQTNIEQGLDVRMGGELKPGTSVTAHLSDQGSSLDGTTREISDFDMIYLSLKDRSYGAIAGDQYASWPFSGLLSGRKKIKGLSASVAPEKTRLSAGAFGALSGGNVTIETKQGRTGVQGPYYLKGKGEQDFIQPVSGTVKIRLNGRDLDEGADKDFIVDYELGTVTFTPKRPIKNEDLIRIEYEYKLFNYQRTLAGGSAGITSPDSLFSVQGVFWSESDNKDHPIDLTLSASDLQALAGAGDRVPEASTSRPVHPNDVARESQLYALYKKRFVNGDSLFVYTPFDVTSPDSVDGFYYVWFRALAAGETGRYRVAFTDHRGNVYDTCSPALATHTDRSALQAPGAKRAGELQANVSLPWLKAKLNVAGQDNDRNLFSSLDDRDNRASATSFSFFAGSKTKERTAAWLSGTHRFTSQRFDAEVISAHDRKELWNDTRLSLNPAERQLWDATAGITPVAQLQTSLSYGQEYSRGALVTDKIAPAAGYRVRDGLLSLDYNGSFFRHHATGEKGSGRRDYGSALLTLPKNSIGLLYRDEWRSDSLGSGSGLHEGAVTWDFEPFRLRQECSYISRRRSESGRFFSIDTGNSFRWEQSIDHAFFPSWRVTGSSSFDRSVDYRAGRSMTMLVDLTSDVDRETRGFSSRQHYRASSEIASSFIQVPVYAGKGMGTHAYDSVRKEYVPHVPGDFFLQQQEVYDSSSNVRVRKSSMDITWSFEPPVPLPGILGDLSWQGTLFCEEHVDADAHGALTWVPGFSSLVANDASPVRYADISYRQDIEWAPRNDSQKTSRGRLSLTPAWRKIREYLEGSIETRLEADREAGRVTFGGAVNQLSLKHDDTVSNSDDYSVSDYRLELSQRFRPVKNLTFSLLEIAGIARKNSGLSSNAFPQPDSALYYQFSPSLSWRPGMKGTVSAQYTWSVVPLPGDMDYRMARGFMAGITHQAGISSDVKMGERLLVIGSYRGDWRMPVGAQGFDPANHLFSLEVRMFL
jgi:hypothetical protein